MKKDKLHNIRSTGFKTPDNYFDSIEDKLFERLSDESSIDDIKHPGFKVPKDYFDSLEDKVFNKITYDVPVVKLNTRKRLYYIAGIAAALILLLAIVIGGNNGTEELSVEMVETYFEESDLDSYELAQLLSEVDLLEDNFVITETQYIEENIEDYLLENTDLESYLE